MDVEQLMKLIDKVSESDLTGFKYEENGIKLQLNKKENLVMGTTAPMQAVTPEAVKVTGASSKSSHRFRKKAYRNRPGHLRRLLLEM